MDSNEAEVSVEVHSVRDGEGFGEMLEVQRLGAGELCTFSLSSLRVSVFPSRVLETRAHSTP